MRCARSMLLLVVFAACGCGEDSSGNGSASESTSGAGASSGTPSGAGAGSATGSGPSSGSGAGGGSSTSTGASGGAGGGPVAVSDYCFCVMGGDNTGDGYASEECKAALLPFQPVVKFCEDFDAEDYGGESGIVGEELFTEWADGPFDHEWDPAGGFVGGAAKFIAHTFDAEDNDGLFVGWPESIADAPQGNVGYLLMAGPDWTESFALNEEWKHTLLGTNEQNSQTAMLMEWPTGDTRYVKRVWSACSMMAGVCEDQFGEQYADPNADHAFVPDEREGEWVWVELEHIPGPSGSVNVYVFTHEGNVVGSGPMASIPSNAQTPHTFTAAMILAYIEGTCVESGQRQSALFPCTADSWAKVDLVKLGDGFIGPPPGL